VDALKIVRDSVVKKNGLWLIGDSGSYCSQSSRYDTPTKASKLLELEPVLEAARKAKENGSTRFCMGAAWRDLAGRKRGFERILKMVREVRGMGMEVCTTLGMLSPEQAKQLKEACVHFMCFHPTFH
jgi:biotin synthase